tara:strand:- start:37182 stop:38315 length:1134 start_codon:yes stop_codon:yes gene_type:complete
MDFGFSEEQREVQALARKILSEQVTPQSLSAYDDDAHERFDRGLWQQLHEAGLPAVAVPHEYGGMGFGFTELALFIEELGRTIAPVPGISHCVSALLPIARFAPQSIRERYLPSAAGGELLLTAALSETLNEDPANPIAMTAVADGECLVLNGHKTMVPFAQQSDRILLAARFADDVAVLLVDPRAAGVQCEALQVTTFEPQYHVQLSDVRVPAADIVCASGGQQLMHWIAEHTAVALCAHQLGAADHAMRLAASYTAERKQFGVPVATFQAVGHRMADCYIDVECLRLTTYQAASLLHAEAEATTEAQIAKIWAGDVGHRVSYAAQHVHGGTGIDRDYPLWRYCLWLRHNEMTLGSSARQLAGLGDRLAQGEALFR